MKHIDQTPQVDPGHFTDSPHGDAMKMMHHRHLSRNLIAIESFRKNPRGFTSENTMTLSTFFMGELIENPLGLHRLTFNHGSIPGRFESQYSPTVWTDLSWVDEDDLIGRLFGVSFSPMPLVTWTGPPFVTSVFFVRIGFKKELGGRG
jgi:hypothetical protein